MTFINTSKKTFIGLIPLITQKIINSGCQEETNYDISLAFDLKRIRSIKHNVYSVSQKKVALSPYNNSMVSYLYTLRRDFNDKT
nr:unnamed protein product [Callosobruchus analis]